MISMKISEAARSIQALHSGADTTFTGCSTDSRKINQGELFIAIRGEHFDGHDFIDNAIELGASAALVDHNVDQDIPIIVSENTRSALGKLAGCWRGRFKIPLVAITGSNGKTTVKEMLVSILQQKAPVLATQGNLNNDIGVPVTLFGLGSEHQYAVIEMGANHAGEISWLSKLARPTVALITQCAPAHLEGFGSVEGVAKAKAEIFEGLEKNGIAIINADDSFAGIWRKMIPGYQQLSFGLDFDADIFANSFPANIIDGGSEFLLTTPKGSIEVNLPLLGRHNIMNALAAAACAIGLEIDLGQIKQGLEKIVPVKGRLQMKAGIRQSRIIDDTYNANPASLSAALKVISTIKGEHWLVLGDMGELGSESIRFHEDAGRQARDNGINRLFTIGTLSQSAVNSFGDNAEYFRDVDQLIERLRNELTPAVTVLVKASRAMQLERVVEALQSGE